MGLRQEVTGDCGNEGTSAERGKGADLSRRRETRNTTTPLRISDSCETAPRPKAFSIGVSSEPLDAAAFVQNRPNPTAPKAVYP